MPNTTGPAVMPPSQLHVGLYARKSVLRENSESVATQIKLCRDYCERAYPDALIHVYDQDEGFSGKNTSRPGFTRLMADVRSGLLGVVIVYRLDRIGRNLRDFCNLLDDLQQHGVAFVSVRENFGGDTPLARTMMYVASIFSQLERELIAERVRDSLYDLARSGRWLGGPVPTGFSSHRVETILGGRTHSAVALSASEPFFSQVRRLYELYTELGGLSALESYTQQNGIRTPSGNLYSRTTLRLLLTNPIYCTADAAAWDHLHAHGYAIYANREDFDGTRGLMAYNKTDRRTSAVVDKPLSEWIISVGAHPGCVPGSLWVSVQQMLEDNKDRSLPLMGRRTEHTLLSGLVRCSRCGSSMRPRVYGDPLPDGRRKAAYACRLKETSRGCLCKMPNAPANAIDDLVLEHLRRLSGTFAELAASGDDLFGDPVEDPSSRIRHLQDELAAAQRQLANLTDTLADGLPAAARRQVYARMEELSATIEALRQEISTLSTSAHSADGQRALVQLVASTFSSFGDAWGTLTHDEQQRLIRTVVESVVWDGEGITINMVGAGSVSKSDLSPKCEARSLAPPTLATLHPPLTPSARLSLARRRTGLTYTQLSSILGISASSISACITNPSLFRAANFSALCAALQASPSWILYGDDPPPMVSLSGLTTAERLRSLRVDTLHLSIATMAANTGTSTTTIRNHEHGRSDPALPHLLHIAAAYGINASIFFP